MSCVMLFGFIFMTQLAQTFNLMSGSTKTDIVDIIVLADDKADSVQDALSYSFGYNSGINSEAATKAISEIESKNNTTLNTKDYTDWSEMVNALYANKNIQAVVMSDSLRSTLTEEFETFEDKTKVIGTITITTQVKLSTSDKRSMKNRLSFICPEMTDTVRFLPTAAAMSIFLPASILKPVRYCLFRHRVITISQLKMLPESLVLIN